MTVAFRDLTKQNFKLAWQQFQPRELYFQFTSAELTLITPSSKTLADSITVSVNCKRTWYAP
jgi:hypothetical protein